MPTTEQFTRLILAASRAPSPDNMQAWAFTHRGDAIDAYLDPHRVLPTDVHAMFAWVGLGAALENLVIAAAREGLRATLDHRTLDREQAVTVHLAPGSDDDPLAEWIERRETNRGPYVDTPLEDHLLCHLTSSIDGLDVGLYWTIGADQLALLAELDARSTYIRLEHPPLHDELFDILRFSRHDVAAIRFGLEFEALGLPTLLAGVARLLRYRPVIELLSHLGIGRLTARRLSSRLRAAQAACLITAHHPSPAGYLEAGRAMERLWLSATARGLAVQPHGVLPQYLTKLHVEPETLGPRFADAMRQHLAPFHALFPGARHEYPAIILRIGRPRTTPARQSVRLPIEDLIR